MAGESEPGALMASLCEVACVQEPGALQQWSLEHPDDFWKACWQLFALPAAGHLGRLRDEAQRFFPDLRLNYAECLLDGFAQDDGAVAVTACSADRMTRQITRGELRRQVMQLASALRRRGVKAGDRVVLVPRSDEHAVVAVLAVFALGGCLALASPEMGAALMAERFRPLAPRLLLAHGAPLPHDSGTLLADRIAELTRALPTLEGLLVLDDSSSRLPPLPIPVMDLAAVLAEAGPLSAWPAFPFHQPFVVTPAVGPDGCTESLVHGAGGVLLEHVKEHRLHLGLGPQDTLYAPASVASPVWLWQLSALASGCRIVLYDGPVRDAGTLWRIAQEGRATVFVPSAPYLRLGEHARLSPGREFGLAALRALWCTGSTPDEAASHWVSEHVKPLPLRALGVCHGMLGSLLLQRPGLPLAHEACRSLGIDLRVAAPEGEAGELVIAAPFPAQPLGFLDDPDGQRYAAAYLARWPGAWASGERVERGADLAMAQRGRMDGLMNVRGAWVPPAEVLACLHGFAEIREAAVVEQLQVTALGEGRAVLLLALQEGHQLDGALIARIRRRLTELASPAHVPDVVLAVPALPRTAEGQLCDGAMRDIVNGRPMRDLPRLRDPEGMQALRNHPALQAPALPIGPLPPPPAPGWRSRQDHEVYLRSLWERIFGFSPIGLDDDFFELGGHSLLAARLFADIQRSTGQDLAPSTLLKAPTIRQLAAVMDAAAWDLPVPLVQLRPGSGRPFFLVHSLAGTFLELWAVLRALDTQRAVYGLQARAIGDAHAPYVSVHEMAADYIGHMRRVQPSGPYAVGGYSFGGLVAYEIAQQLCRSGETVELVTLIDTHVHGRYLPTREWVRYCADWLRITGRRLQSLPLRGQLDYLRKKAVVLVDRLRVATGQRPKRPELVGDLLREANFPPALRRVRGAMLMALREYRPEPYPGRVVFLRASRPSPGDPIPVWRKVVLGGLEIDITPGDHDEMISGANAKALALALARHL